MKRVIGFLSTAAFLTAALLVALAGTAAAQTAPTLDHFYCYFAQGEIRPKRFMLQDQFDVGLNPLIPPEVETVQLLKIVRFCNPVQKTTADGKVTGIQHPADHLAMYLFTPDPWSSHPIIPRVVIIRNQFGTQRIRTANAVLLAVPSGKVWPVPVTNLPPPPNIPTDIDHFKCYLASGRAIDRRVLLKDQFFQDTREGVLAAVLQPILFCNPVKKTIPPISPTAPPSITSITNPDGHLACYVTTRRNFQSTLLYDNQFSPQLAGLLVSRPDFLCVPSLKLKWAVVPAPSSLVPPD